MKVAIISGGTKGLGRELALRFGADDFSVVALYRGDDAGAAHAREAFLKAGIVGQTCKVNLALDALESLPSIKARQLVLIHNACPPFEPKPFHLLTPDDFKKMTDTTIVGSARLTQHYLRDLLAAESKMIVNVLSSALDSPIPKGFSQYISAKAGLQALGDCLLAEYGQRGLQVQNVRPGFMKSELTQGWKQPFQSTEPVSAKAVAEQIHSNWLNSTHRLDN